MEDPGAPQQPPGAKGHAGRKVMLIIGSQAAGTALGLLSIVFTVSYIPSAALGSYAFAGAIVGFVIAGGNLGIGQAHQRHVSQGVDLAQATGVQVRLRLAAYGAATALAAVVLWVWTSVLHRSLESTTPAVFAAAIATGVLGVLRGIPMETWSAQQRVHRVEMIKLVDTIVTVVSFGAVAFSVGLVAGGYPPPPPQFASVASALGIEPGITLEGIALAVALAYLTGKTASMLPILWWWVRDGGGIGRWDGPLARSYMRFGLPLALTSVIGLVVQYTDIFVIGILWDPSAVGHYALAMRVAGVASIASIAVGAVLFPRFTALFALGDRARALAVFQAAERYSLMVMAPAAAGLVSLAHVLLTFGKDEYLRAAGPLQALALSVVVGALAAPLSSKFLGDNAVRVAVISASLSAVLNLVLNLLLVPKSLGGLGPTGAGLASLAAGMASYAYLRQRARRSYGLPWFEASLVRIAAAALVAGLFWWLAAQLAPPGWLARFWQVGVLGAVGLVVYGASLALMGELRKADLRFALGLLHPGRMLDELRGR